MDDLFSRERQPLAARMRPRTFAEFFGQEQILAPGRLLRRAIEADQISSIILSGPPGTGKTTLARIIAAGTRSQFIAINAVLSGVKEVRHAIQQAQDYRHQSNLRTILFVDEVHRWNRSQQDALLPWVEEGLVILVGATTENPWFEVNRALLSRSRIFLLQPLSEQELDNVLTMALEDRDRGYGRLDVTLTAEARNHLIRSASGDARTLLNALELAVETSGSTTPPQEDDTIFIDIAVAEESIQQRAVLYDKDGDYHFDTISAFIKSVRGSDPDAALYWLARMITAGEDPRFILRRLLILAGEDIGMADPTAITVVHACAAAFDRVGLPEGQFHLAHATLYCATTEKSNSLMGYFAALQAVQTAEEDSVPDHLKDAARDGAALGHGAGYQYPHAFREHWVAQQYLPDALKGRLFYTPGDVGWEGARQQSIESRRREQSGLEQEFANPVGVVMPASSSTERWLLRADHQTRNHVRKLQQHVLPGFTPRPPQPTERILLHGSPLQLFLWHYTAVVPAGLVAAWASEEQEYQEIITALEHSPLQGVDRPEISYTPYGQIPDDSHVFHGPFDWIILRPPVLAKQEWNVSWVASFLSPAGTVSTVLVDTTASSSFSDVPDLPESLLHRLQHIEQDLLPSRLPDTGAFQETSGWKTRTETVNITIPRRLNGAVLSSWLAPETPYGNAFQQLVSPDEYSEIRTTLARQAPREVPWQRVYHIVTAVRDS
jgi:putative ATPase